uniref:Uncharacterized protein n=1 Tax=Octopus bimaculoides TaxID=37653 RepID=A0A0L8GUA1_OCTBM
MCRERVQNLYNTELSCTTHDPMSQERASKQLIDSQITP